MSDKRQVPIELLLEYWNQGERPGIFYGNAPVHPAHTDELTIAIRCDDDSVEDPRAQIVFCRPQVHLVGTARSLEEFGRYLIALARLETSDPNPHDHFEDVQSDDGGAVHLIVRRKQ